MWAVRDAIYEVLDAGDVLAEAGISAMPKVKK
jgi:hypothetical protein